MRYYRLATDEGDARAMNMVGDAQFSGTGGPEEDAAEAARWYRRYRGADLRRRGLFRPDTVAPVIEARSGVRVASGLYRGR